MLLRLLTFFFFVYFQVCAKWCWLDRIVSYISSKMVKSSKTWRLSFSQIFFKTAISNVQKLKIMKIWVFLKYYSKLQKLKFSKIQNPYMSKSSSKISNAQKFSYRAQLTLSIIQIFQKLKFSIAQKFKKHANKPF